jgi:hypothetical protein
MSRANVPDGPFFAAFAARILACGGLAYAFIRICQSMYDDISFELGGLENFQRHH